MCVSLLALSPRKAVLQPLLASNSIERRGQYSLNRQLGPRTSYELSLIHLLNRHVLSLYLPSMACYVLLSIMFNFIRQKHALLYPLQVMNKVSRLHSPVNLLVHLDRVAPVFESIINVSNFSTRKSYNMKFPSFLCSEFK